MDFKISDEDMLTIWKNNLIHNGKILIGASYLNMYILSGYPRPPSQDLLDYFKIKYEEYEDLIKYMIRRLDEIIEKSPVTTENMVIFRGESRLKETSSNENELIVYPNFTSFSSNIQTAHEFTLPFSEGRRNSFMIFLFLPKGSKCLKIPILYGDGDIKLDEDEYLITRGMNLQIRKRIDETNIFPKVIEVCPSGYHGKIDWPETTEIKERILKVNNQLEEIKNNFSDYKVSRNIYNVLYDNPDILSIPLIYGEDYDKISLRNGNLTYIEFYKLIRKVLETKYKTLDKKIKLYAAFDSLEDEVPLYEITNKNILTILNEELFMYDEYYQKPRHYHIKNNVKNPIYYKYIFVLSVHPKVRICCCKNPSIFERFIIILPPYSYNVKMYRNDVNKFNLPIIRYEIDILPNLSN